MYTGILGAATTTTAAVVLPNTGGNHLLAVTAMVSLVAGIIAVATSAIRLVAKRVYQA
jgi:hypothetical protein